MRYPALGLTLCLAISGPNSVAALDCVIDSPGNHVRRLVNAGTPHIVVRGIMEFDSGQDRFAPLVDGGRDLNLTGVLTGRILTPDGPGELVELQVTERHFCHDPWCDGPPPNQADPSEGFYILRKSRHGLFFESGMCAFEVYGGDDDTAAEILACMVNSPDCPPPQY